MFYPSLPTGFGLGIDQTPLTLRQGTQTQRIGLVLHRSPPSEEGLTSAPQGGPSNPARY